MDIKGFTGKYRFLSNFYPVDFVLDGVKYFCSEQAYMVAKTTDILYIEMIMKAKTAGQCKAIGRKVPLRADWNEKYRDRAMLRALQAKFSIPEMAELLLETDAAYLEETNHWNDCYWGVCNGIGKNMLGRMLMYLRKDIRNKRKVQTF